MKKRESIKTVDSKINIDQKFLLSSAIGQEEKNKFKDKRVFLRADFNVPFEMEQDGKIKIINYHKIESTLPTIDALLASGAKIILATHIGRPNLESNDFKNNQNSLDKTVNNPNLESNNSKSGQTSLENVSCKIFLDFFKDRGYKIIFRQDLQEALNSSTQENYQIMLLENLRFFSGERANRNYATQEKATEFAKQLFGLADYFVNDAFAVSHKNDTSITALPEMFDKNKIFIGLLAEKELNSVQELYARPKKGFTVIVGGGKVTSKLNLIEKILPKIENLLLCPAIDFPFMKYFDDNIGKSLFDPQTVAIAHKIIEAAHANGVQIVYPLDFIVAEDNFEGQLYDVDKPEIPENFVGVSIGPKTAKNFAEIIKKSKTVFFNGLSGNIKKPQSLEGMKTIFKTMGKNGNKTHFCIIGGGDSVAAANLLDATTGINHLLTAGGACLAFLADQNLPGLKAFMQK